MKTGNQIIIAAAVIAGSVLGALAHAAVGNGTVAAFKIDISVNRIENGVNLKCHEGCVWETLSFTCDSDQDCASSIDETGTPAQ